MHAPCVCYLGEGTASCLSGIRRLESSVLFNIQKQDLCEGETHEISA
jgi:hypothetical protein